MVPSGVEERHAIEEGGITDPSMLDPDTLVAQFGKTARVDESDPYAVDTPAQQPEMVGQSVGRAVTHAIINDHRPPGRRGPVYFDLS